MSSTPLRVVSIPIIGATLATLGRRLPCISRVTQLALCQVIESLLLAPEHLQLVLALIRVGLTVPDRRGIMILVGRLTTEPSTQKAHLVSLSRSANREAPYGSPMLRRLRWLRVDVRQWRRLGGSYDRGVCQCGEPRTSGVEARMFREQERQASSMPLDAWETPPSPSSSDGAGRPRGRWIT